MRVFARGRVVASVVLACGVALSSGCRPKTSSDDGASGEVARTEAPATAGEASGAEAPPATGVLAEDEIAYEALDCMARSAGLRVDGEGLVPEELTPTTPMPEGTTRIGRAYIGGSGGRVILHAFAYPLAGFAGPHVRDLQDRGSLDDAAGVWAIARGRFVIASDARTSTLARDIAERVAQSPCW